MSAPADRVVVGRPGLKVRIGFYFGWVPGYGTPHLKPATVAEMEQALAELGIPDEMGVFAPLSDPAKAIRMPKGPALSAIFQRASGPLYLARRPLRDEPDERAVRFMVSLVFLE